MTWFNRCWMVLGLAGWLSAGCGEGEPPVPSHTLYGTITSTSVDASGRWAWVRLFAPDSQAEALYSTSCQLSGPGCDYRIPLVEEGRYTVLAFIDLDDNASIETPEPDSGDLAAQARPLILWDKTEMNFQDSLWREIR